MKTTQKKFTNQKDKLERIKARIKELEKYEVELRNLYQNLWLDAEREEKGNDNDKVVEH